MASSSSSSSATTTTKGGVKVTDAEVEAAFRFFDPEGKGKITLADLRKRLQPFYKDMPIAEYKFLMGEAKSMTVEDLKTLLADNDVAGFDPVAEAFKVYDPGNTGYVQPNVLKDIFRRLGFEDLSQEDMTVLLETADVDGDGRISLEDFRAMLDVASRPHAASEER